MPRHREQISMAQLVAKMSGGRLLEEVARSAANYFADIDGADPDVIKRAIEARFAATGVARKYHSETCRFPSGDPFCNCSDSHWSWPLAGLDKGLE